MPFHYIMLVALFGLFVWVIWKFLMIPLLERICGRKITRKSINEKLESLERTEEDLVLHIEEAELTVELKDKEQAAQKAEERLRRADEQLEETYRNRR